MSLDAFGDMPISSGARRAGDGASPRGDGGAAPDQIDRLFRSQAPRLLRYLSRRAARGEDAADLLQETFLRLVRLSSVETLPARPEAYLQRIATNLLRDQARRALTHADELHGPIDEDSLADAGPGPASQIEARELLSQYEDALSRLRTKTREIFLLHRRDGLTYAQIAAEAGLSVSGVEKHMMKAIAHIDRVLGRP
jgi:RNA polymerase sigma factor (sigma-70 family)